MAVSIYIPTNSVRVFFLTPSPAFIVSRFFDDDHSDQCEVISHCSLDLHLSNNEWCWVPFHVFIRHLYVFFRETSIQIFCPFFDWIFFVFLVLSCMSCLYILEINPLSVVSFVIIFSHSESCLFTLFIVSFAAQKLLIRSCLFIFVLFPITLGGRSSRILLWFMSECSAYVFPLRV